MLHLLGEDFAILLKTATTQTQDKLQGIGILHDKWNAYKTAVNILAFSIEYLNIIISHVIKNYT